MGHYGDYTPKYLQDIMGQTEHSYRVITADYLNRLHLYQSALDTLIYFAQDLEKYIRKERREKKYIAKKHALFTENEVAAHYAMQCALWAQRLAKQYELTAERAAAVGTALPFTLEDLMKYTHIKYIRDKEEIWK